MPGQFTPLSAKFAQVRFNAGSGPGTTITAKKWTVTPTADILDVTNFEGAVAAVVPNPNVNGAGFADYISGILQCEFSIEGDWDSANDIFGVPLGPFVIGQYITGVKLYTNLVGSSFWLFNAAVISETPWTAAVRETITFSITCKGKGAFTYP